MNINELIESAEDFAMQASRQSNAEYQNSLANVSHALSNLAMVKIYVAQEERALQNEQIVLSDTKRMLENQEKSIELQTVLTKTSTNENHSISQVT